jgi:hypothetical protein
MKAPRKKSSKSKETPETVELVWDNPYAPGKPSEVLLNYAEGHYKKVFADNGEMMFLDKHTQKTLKISEESKFFMEILHGYDILAG